MRKFLEDWIFTSPSFLVSCFFILFFISSCQPVPAEAQAPQAFYETQRINRFTVYEFKTLKGFDCVVSTASSQSMAMSCNWDRRQ